MTRRLGHSVCSSALRGARLLWAVDARRLGAEDGRLGWSWAADRTAWITLDAAIIIARHFVDLFSRSNFGN